VLIMTTSCDAGVRVDLSCDSCDVLFAPRESTPQIPTAVWTAAAARGWWHGPGATSLGRHLCPACAVDQKDRLVEVAHGS
jgi:hypothetical protein